MEYSEATSTDTSRYHVESLEPATPQPERSDRLIRNVMGIDRREEAFRRCLPVCYQTEIDMEKSIVMEYPSGRLEQIEIDENDNFVVVKVIQK